MPATKKRFFRKSFDFVYLTPAILCNAAFLCGIVPAVFCLDATLFAYISVAIFVVSIAAHLYILYQWKLYLDSSPFAYAIIQPALHLVLLSFALVVGSTNICTPSPPEPGTLMLDDNPLFRADTNMSEAVSDEANKI